MELQLLDAVLIVFARSKTDEISPLLQAVLETLDIHASIFTAVAFGRAYSTETWKDARMYSRALIRTALVMDVRVICNSIQRLATATPKTGPIQYPKVREQIWKKTYESILPNDSEGIATIVGVISSIAHLDDLHEGPFSTILRSHPNKEDLMRVMRGVNRALNIFRTGFADAVNRYLDFTEPSSALSLLRQRSIADSVMALMFSPTELLRRPVQNLVGLALDVESRMDCFRALLQNNPDAAFNGIFSVLERFIHITTTMPEACNLSKALALCLTDIIDVLCSSPDGLLHKTHFLQSFQQAGPETQLPKWWGLMAKAITHIFQRTPRWAEYFENEMMVLWMRDALIFGRDMLAQRQLIESSALALSLQPSANRSKSHIGKKMVDDLQQVLLELTRWLRLTDEELLFQAFALLQSLLSCFQAAKVKPGELALQKLQKHVNDARTPDPKRPQTRLDSTRVDRLQDSISAFEEKDEESDDEIQIVKHVIRAPAEPRKKEKVKKEPVLSTASTLTAPKTKMAQAPFTKPPKPIRLEPSRRASTKSSTISSYFTADDQKKLDSVSSMPRLAKSSAISSSKPSISTSSTPTTRDTIPETKSASSSAAPSVAASSSESSDEDEESGLASLAKLQRTPAVKKPPERRQVKMLDLPGNVKNPALERLNNRSARDEAKRTAMRLKPDVTYLHRALLLWDYDDNSDQPPGSNLRLLNVPDRFEDGQHYRDVFEPLLLMECWAAIQASKENNEEKYGCQVLTRQYSDDWVDLDIAITDSVKKDWMLTDSEIVLLRHPDGKKSYLCKVQNYKTTFRGINATLRMMAPKDGNGPQINTSWVLSKVYRLVFVTSGSSFHL
jgi:senataxin